MRKSLFSLWGVIIIAAVSMPLLIAQPDSIIIDNPHVYRKKQRPAVSFPHGLHMGAVESCKKCHHSYDKGKNVLNEDELMEGKMKLHCSDCHLRKVYGKKYALRDAYHAQCVGCHRDLIKEGKKSGPQLCGKCHPWQ